MNRVMDGLRIKLFADGANLEQILSLASDPRIEGFTTNPTLMRQAQVDDYGRFVKELTARISDRPISFEVISDDFTEMERQAHALHDLGDNVVVKIPVTDTKGASAAALMARLAASGISVNATALMTLAQVHEVAAALAGGPAAVVSVFAGRIADAGVDPVPMMRDAKQMLAPYPNLELLWASPREVLNVVQADAAGCDIITLTSGLLDKLPGLGRDLDEFSLATVRMFYDDAVASAYDF